MLIDVEVFVNAQYGYDIRCELVGETGTLRLGEQVAPDFRARFATAYRRELEGWVQGLEDGPQRVGRLRRQRGRRRLPGVPRHGRARARRDGAPARAVQLIP